MKMDATVKHSFKWVFIFMAMAMAAAAGIAVFYDTTHALEFIGCYLLEFSLSMDNVFVFLSIFASFGVPEPYQHRCLAYGIIGAVVLRLLFIMLGASIVHSFSWILYIFGFILIYSGIKMMREGEEEEKNPHDNTVLKLLNKFLPVTPDFVGNRFFVKERGRWLMTPLFAVLVVIESSDVMFAIDSVPAAFSVSSTTWIIYAANIFAILGLRQLFFVIEHMQERFALMKYGVAAILTFTGIKLALLMFDIHISIPVSIGFIITALTISICCSLFFTRNKA